MRGRRRGGPPGPSEAALAAAWHARRCVACGAAVMAVVLPGEGDDINLCETHYQAHLRHGLMPDRQVAP
jgi:hypothetical protein